MREKILSCLLEAADTNYKAFNDRIVNAAIENESLGVRIPVLKKLCREIAKGSYGDFFEYFKDIDGLMKEAPQTLFQEEHMLYGMLIGMADMWPANREHCMDHWIPTIMSWADCDSATGTWKFIGKDREYWYPYIVKWLSSGREFELRAALVLLMQYYMTEDYIERLLERYGKNYSDAYYVRMGQAWALSVCFVKFREETLRFFENNRLDDWTHNKAIQKCRESFRVSEADKALLQSLKR